jgi:tRNA threonylcarbamoyl adenosine modification protein YeaZ/ribosomal-protein-alanine acetyltransferase
MVMLVIDTCLGACSAALYDRAAGRVLGHHHTLMEKGHAETLPPLVDALLRAQGLSANQLDAIAVTIGPGSFTGVRIGLSFARGMAVALNIPVIGIDTLTATAAPLLATGGAVLVAHRAGASGHVYAARFNTSAHDGIALLLPEEMIVPENETVIGTAADQFPQARRHIACDLPLAHLFADYAATLPAGNEPPEPLYIRSPDAKPQPGNKRVIEALTLFPATSEAAPVLAALHATSFDHPWTEQSFRDMFGVAGTVALLAGTPLGPQGFVLARQIADEAEILTIATAPHMRQRGLGRALLDAVSAQLKQAGTHHLHLEVASDNAAAQALYRRCGFVQSGYRRNYYQRAEGLVDAILMRRVLSS